MTNPTTPFSWQMPTASDLVTDLPADFETFGQAVATSLADLLGGTTGQVLAKASNTDMDFTWVAIDPLVILDAKGDLITATAADTPARLAVGSNNQVLTADSTTATGLKWATPTSGLTLVNTTTIGSGVSSVSLNSVFTSTYTNYKVFILWDQCSASLPTVSLRLRASGTDNTGAFAYQPRGWKNTSATLTGHGSAGSSIALGVINTAGSAFTHMEVLTPQVAARQTGFVIDHYETYNNDAWGFNATHTITASYDGFTVFPSSGTLTAGTIYVYGYGL